MIGIEALRNIVHREVQRVLDRRARRAPCIVDSYDGNTHRVKVKLQPEGTLTGWMQIETMQVGLLVAPNIGDPGWIEFHENDRRAGVFVASAHNNQKPPPIAILAGELYYQNGKGQRVYVKSDGSITAADGAGASVKMQAGVTTIGDKAGQTIVQDGAGKTTITAPVIELNGAVWFVGNAYGLNGAGQINVGVPIVQTNGGITTSGSVAASGDVTAGGISLESHVHPGVQPGGGDTGPPIG